MSPWQYRESLRGDGELLASLAGKTEHKTPLGRNVATQIKVHHIAGVLQIVGPFEIHAEAALSFRQAKCRPGNRQMQLVALDAIVQGDDLFPLPTALVFLKPGFAALDRTIQREVAALPAGRRILVGVDQQQ